MKACKNCHRLTDGQVCSLCNAPTSKSWQGYVVIAHPDKSYIARKMNIRQKGKYALKVR